MTFRVDAVEFDDIDLPLRIYKARGLRRAEVLSYFSSQENRRTVVARFDELEPLSVKTALTLPNIEQRMVALRSFDPKTILDRAKAKLLDRQTITKTRTTWDQNLRPVVSTYDDTYELFTFASKETDFRGGVLSVDYYVVACTCPSTGHQFHLFVPPSVGSAADAVAAVAWTMQIDGTPISKEQYLTLLYAET